MKKRIVAKTVNGNVVKNFGGMFIWDMFQPDTITIEFDGPTVWQFDINLLKEGGDFGGDIAVVIDDDDTVIALIDPKTSVPTTIVFSTPVIQWFITQAMLGVDIPTMREVEVDNCIVEFYDYTERLGMV